MSHPETASKLCNVEAPPAYPATQYATRDPPGYVTSEKVKVVMMLAMGVKVVEGVTELCTINFVLCSVLSGIFCDDVNTLIMNM